MAYESPLFQSSLELFGHSIEHFNGGTDKDRKFVILHLANSIELIFKDLLLDLGESIYKNPKETITITSSIKVLTDDKNVKIPHLNKLELLIDERNSLQHRYGFPNELTTIFYMEATYSFFKDFLKDNYDLVIDEVMAEFISEDDLKTFQLRHVKNIHELDKLLKVSKIHPVGALLSAYRYLEKRLLGIVEKIQLSISKDNIEDKNLDYWVTRQITDISNLSNNLRIYDINLENNDRETLEALRRLRNQTAHGREEPSMKEVTKMIEFIKSFESKINEFQNKILGNPSKFIKTREDELPF